MRGGAVPEVCGEELANGLRVLGLVTFARKCCGVEEGEEGEEGPLVEFGGRLVNDLERGEVWLRRVEEG